MLKDAFMQLANDREHTNVPILLYLLKVFGAILVGSASDKGTEEIETKVGSMAIEDDQLLSKEMQAKFRKLIETYYGTLAKRIVKEYTRLQEQDKRNHEAYIKSGEIFEDRQQNYEKMSKEYEKLESWGKKFSDLIGVPMPELANESKSTGIGLAINMDSGSNNAVYDKSEAEFASGKSPWEDEDTRRFYEDLVDLSELVPMSLLNQGQTKAKPDEKAISSPEMATAKDLEEGEKSAVGSPEVNSVELSKDTTDKKEEADENSTIGAGPAAQLNALLAKLPDLYNRAMIDTAAVDFAFLNTKVARKKLIKQLGAVPRNRTDLIPHYARLIATLNRYMPDIGQGVMSVLDEEFRYLQRKRNVDLAETRSKNMRFIGELTKFQVAPLYATFHFFKVCLDDFTGPNIDNMATLLETCGRYLLRSPETSERMSSTLEMLRRKRAAQNLDSRQLVLLDNAYYQCNPPEREATLQKEYTGIQLYINHLIYDVLTKKAMDHVVEKLRKLPWNDAQVLETLRNVFIRAWRIRFSHLHLLAVLLHELQAYHPDFVVYIIDNVCENIRAGMESNIFKDNQRRVATAKYLGELYNYRLVNSTIIFDQLWSFVTFGHPNGRPLPGQVSPIDAPDDYFRIRLVCTLLDACGHCFDRGVLRKKLDDYLLFLNIYTLSKVQPLPMDADFMLSDTLESLRPQFRLKKTFEEAAVAVDEMLALQNAKATADATSNSNGQAEAMVIDENMDSQSEQSDEDMLGPRQQQSRSTSESEGDEEDVDELEDVAMDEEDDELITRETEDDSVDQDAEEEFERELAKMMAESNSATSASIKHGQRGLFDVGMPFIKKSVGGAAVSAQQDSSLVADDQHMRFSFLSKRGNKHQTHQVSVPIDAAIAVNSRANEKQQLAERQQLKQLVLGIETREQMEDRRCKFHLLTSIVLASSSPSKLSSSSRRGHGQERLPC
jgi:regulator of nonsense transcripts 2